LGKAGNLFENLFQNICGDTEKVIGENFVAQFLKDRRYIKIR
jgi:hypothetical protein